MMADGNMLVFEQSASLQMRSYQLEMYSESLERNILVAMDTGSGKTLVAILRIQHELEQTTTPKIIWFMCPTVELADQQAGKLRDHLGSSYQIKLLTGNDAVDTWRSQKVWEEALKNVNVVVCTYPILLDGLAHGFINLSDISLLVFDEAHHCSRGYAANRIMQQFYHVAKKEKPEAALPNILRLSASPVVRRDPKTLQELEQNLDAICKTPRTNRAELLRYVNRPVMVPILYQANISTTSDALLHISNCYEGMDVMQDPLSISRTLTHQELGSWAARYYIHACVTTFLMSYKDYASLEGDTSEKLYLHTILSRMEFAEPSIHELSAADAMSPKLHQLIRVLQNEMKPQDTSGIVFVKTRAEVQILSVIFARLSATKDLLRTATFVGGSNNRLKRSKISELLNASHEPSAVESLRSGRKNLIICTSVCEEGIDISACNLVICFETPPNLKSFIQRRGRARAMASKFIIMQLGDEKNAKRISELQDLERQMEKEYMDEMRKLEELEKLESEDDGYRELVVASTGAQVTLHSGVQHLYHFCAKLPHTAYTTLEPVFTFEEQGIGEARKVSCRIELPNCMDGSIRKYASQEWWRSEKMARMDAAFVAYAGLRAAGLVNDNLLPMPQIDEEAEKAYAEVTKRPSMVQVEPQLDPWRQVARLWFQSQEHLWVSYIHVESNTATSFTMKLLLPCELPVVPSLKLYIDAETTVTITFDNVQRTSYDDASLLRAKEATHVLLSSTFGTRMDKEKVDFPAFFMPAAQEHCTAYFETEFGNYPATNLLNKHKNIADVGLITTRDGRRYVFHGVELRIPEQVEDKPALNQPVPHLRCRLTAKRADFLHPVTGPPPSGTSFEYLLPQNCFDSQLPLQFVNLARMVPCIMYHIGRTMAVHELEKDLLKSIGLDANHALHIATTTSASRAGYDYQRLEFLGDTVLKMMTTVTLMAQHPKWHEGYLAHQKDHIVSNGRLALAAQTVGLVKYIATKQFTAHKWKPLYNDELVSGEETVVAQPRELSTKTLADVVEAIIGVAFTQSELGLEKATAVLKVFLPEVKWQPLAELNQNLRQLAAPASTSCENYAQIPRLESLFNYTFNNKALLLEAITHPSLTTSPVPSYQRLEFLGDAILDYIVTNTIYNHPKKPSVPRMHRLRSATVNAGYLAYCALSTAIQITINHTTPPQDTDAPPVLTPTTVSYNLLSALRRAPIPALSAALNATRRRYDILQPQLHTSLVSGTQYPWCLFSAFGLEKTVSDIMEALLGAVWIDCGGDWDVVTQLARIIGLLTWLERALDEDIGCWHPKEEVGSFGLGGEDGGVKYVVFRGTDAHAEEEELVTMKEDEKSRSETVRRDDNADDINKIEIGKGTWHCRIVVNGESICVASGWNRLEVETAAAEQAVGILEARKVARRERLLREDEIMPDAGYDESPNDDVSGNGDDNDHDIADFNATASNAGETVQQEHDDDDDEIEAVAREQTNTESPRKRKRASVDEVTNDIGRSRMGCLAS